MCPPTILLFLGQRRAAVQALLHSREEHKQRPLWWEGWYDKRFDFECGLITADELLRAAGTCRPKLSQAHFSIGLHRLADGDRKSARVHFRKCADTQLFTWFWDYMWAVAFLARMEKDPAWPPWIPLKN
jgi:hypothetical protein